MIGGPAITMPSVASTDRRKLKLVPSAGSATRRPITARQRKLSPRPVRPPDRDTSPMAPISAARRTLASGPTISTNSASPARAAPAAGARGQANAPGSQQQRAQDQAAVGPADGRQVGHPDRFHGAFKLFIQQAGVTGHHSRQQPPRIAADPFRRGRKLPPSAAGPSCQGAAASRVTGGEDAVRTPASGAGISRPQLPCGPDPLAEDRMLPVSSAHDDDGGLRTEQPAAGIQRLDHGRHRPTLRQGRLPGVLSARGAPVISTSATTDADRRWPLPRDRHAFARRTPRNGPRRQRRAPGRPQRSSGSSAGCGRGRLAAAATGRRKHLPRRHTRRHAQQPCRREPRAGDRSCPHEQCRRRQTDVDPRPQLAGGRRVRRIGEKPLPDLFAQACSPPAAPARRGQRPCPVPGRLAATFPGPDLDCCAAGRRLTGRHPGRRLPD